MVVPEERIEQVRLIEGHLAGFMDFLGNQETCEWCRHPRRPIRPRLRLCNHCNALRLKLRRMEAEAETYRQEHRGLTDLMERHLLIQRTMIENAQAEGQKYGRLYDDDFIPLGLEHEWRLVSGNYVNDDRLFYGIANDLDWSLTLNQKRYIFYLLSLMNREWMRSNRRKLALSYLFHQEQEEYRLRREREREQRERQEIPVREAD